MPPRIPTDTPSSPAKSSPPPPASKAARVTRGKCQIVFINQKSEVFNSSIDIGAELSISDIKQIGKLGIDIMTGGTDEVDARRLLLFVQPSAEAMVNLIDTDSQILVIHEDAFKQWSP